MGTVFLFVLLGVWTLLQQQVMSENKLQIARDNDETKLFLFKAVPYIRISAVLSGVTVDILLCLLLNILGNKWK